MRVLLLGLALAACATEVDSGDGGGGKGDRPARCAAPGLAIAGEWDFEQWHDLSFAAERPGHWLSEFSAGFDGGDDPLRYVWDEMLGSLGAEEAWLEEMLREAGPEVFRRYPGVLPGSWDRLVRLAADARSLSLRFGLRAKLEIGPRRSTCDYRGRLEVQALLANSGEGLLVEPLGRVVVEDVPIAADGKGGISFPKLVLAFPHGSTVIRALEGQILGGRSLGERLAEWVSCPDLALITADVVQPEPSSHDVLVNLTRTHCSLSAVLAGGRLAQILQYGGLVLRLRGDGRLEDGDRDGAADQIVAGTWHGTVGIGEPDLPLEGAQSFAARR